MPLCFTAASQPSSANFFLPVKQKTKNYEPVHEAWVTVSADEPVTGTVELSYMVSNAGWTPSYDLRSAGTSQPVALTYKANVFQGTGEDWNDVLLKLSTGNPNRSSIKPELPVWYLNYFYPQRESTMSTMGAPVPNMDMDDKRQMYKKSIDELVAGNPELGTLLHPLLPYNKATIVWAVQEEMCMTIEDALSRRTRALLLDAGAAIEAAPLVAQLMAAAMKKDEHWIQQQLEAFYAIAKHYLPEKVSAR